MTKIPKDSENLLRRAEADARAIEKKTARLKALRLAREEQYRQAAAAKNQDRPR